MASLKTLLRRKGKKKGRLASKRPQSPAWLRIKQRIGLLNKLIRRKRRLLEKAGIDPNPASNGLSTFDGKQVAAWMVGKARGPDGKIVNWLLRSRNAGWTGTVVSGYRSPEYSESLCRAMCGAPTCSGRCAGRGSNHSQTGPPNWGAIDVSDYTNFGRIQSRIGSPLHNSLGSADPVHFSYTGR